MAEVYYPSEDKYSRAKRAVANYDRLSQKKPGLVDFSLVAKGKAEKLDGEELVRFIYEGLGGKPVITGSEAKEAKEKAEMAKKRVKTRENKALEREKTTVK